VACRRRPGRLTTAITLAAIQGAGSGPALRLYRRATGLLRTTRAQPAVARSAAGEGGGQLGDEAALRALYRHKAPLAAPAPVALTA
jgi:hypothetical protein